MKKQILLMALAATMLSCGNSKPEYASVDEYPTKRGSLEEMHYSTSRTRFSVWSPNANAVYLNLYEDATTEEATERLPMERKKDGSWTLSVHRDLKGMFYTFSVNEPACGWTLHETPGIFAKAVGINGKRAAIVDMNATNPEGWAKDRRPAMKDYKDAIIYEMHHRDFSIDPSSGIEHRGKFLALTEHGTKNPMGASTGIDHLVELGVTHIQILPSYDFGSIDETGAGSEARVLESGAAVGGAYNWGYDPINYNVPEGSYSTDPADPECRIREFKQMVQACHEAGIRVILDVVYNHTYDVENSNFTQTAPNYFYRTTEDGQLGNASGCGNETASNRPMMREFILQSTRYWLEEYHLDGFRFDLMGIHDMETMKAVRKMMDDIDPTLLLYGEGWAAGTPQYPSELLAMKANVHEMPGVGAFCDDMRDGLRGPFYDDHEGAFLACLPGNEESVKFGIVGCIAHPGVDMGKINHSSDAWAAEPTQCISYVSCHDDMMLTDRLMASVDLQPGEMERLDMLAQTAVLTSQGIPFLWNGEEVMRNKKGVHNSFCSPDSINAIDWNLKSENHQLYVYYQLLIQLRKAHPAFRMGKAADVIEHVSFLKTPSCVIAYRITDCAEDEWKDIIVVLNARREAVEITLPEEDYLVALNSNLDDETGTIYGGKSKIPAQYALVLYRK